MMLEELFKQYEGSLWGVASLETAIEDARGYQCIVFGLPYDERAVAALPEDRLINCCRRELSAKAQAIYAALRENHPERGFEAYDDVDRKLKLREKQVSQKVLGHLAGLGWIGKSLLLISPDWGPRIRLGTLFTQDDLEATGAPCVGDCGDCTVCAEVCPSGAIGAKGYDVAKCRSVVTDEKGNYKTFCGLCMQVCPRGSSS